MIGFGTPARRASTRGSGAVQVIAPALAAAGLILAAVAPALAENAGEGGARVNAIVRFDAPPGRPGRDAVKAAGGAVRADLRIVNGLAIELPRGRFAVLARQPHVISVENDVTITAVEPQAAPAPTGDLEYDNAWGVTKIGSKVAHDQGIWGQGVKVAVIDSGIDYIHNSITDVPYVVDPEFDLNYKGGYDFVNNDADPMDDNGHGTHVAGILAAQKNGYLVVGVAPRVDLYGLKVLAADGTGYESNLILAIQWAVTNNINVVNMSLGTHDIVPALQAAVQNAAAAGLLMVAASGNTSLAELFSGCPVAYPGAYPEVLSTTFTNVDDALTGYSCTGPEVDFAAPGDNIFSPIPVGTCMLCSDLGYAAESGTSMASPHLAGSVALLLSAGIQDLGTPGLFDDVKNRLCATATQGAGVSGLFGGITAIPPTDPRYPQYFGCGVINVGAAVSGLTSPPTNRPPIAVNDSATTTAGTPVTIAVLANDTDVEGSPLTVASVSAPAHGTAVKNANETVTYTPNAGYSGPDAFGYTASDGSAISNVATVSITVNPAPPPSPLHVGDLDRTTTISGRTWTAKVTIRIDDASHGAVSGAVVTGIWSDGATGTGTCTTTTTGTCSIQKTKLSRSAVASVRFTVTGVTRTGGTYTPSANHDPDVPVDSNGTTIVILRPA